MMRNAICPTVIIICLFVAGTFLIIRFGTKMAIPDSLSSSEFDLEKRTRAMDTSEALMNVSRSLDIHWVDIICAESDPVVPLEDIYATLQRSNAILLRSDSDFRMQLANRSTLVDISLCSISVSNENQMNDILGKFLSKTGTKVLSVTIENPTRSLRTKGFSIPGSSIAVVDRSEFKIPSVTLMHELGHAWSLPHPFNSQGSPFGDLPPVCSDISRRVYQMETCPEKLRTCSRSDTDEMLNNVMDYLPEHCGRKYYFSKFQIETIRKFHHGGIPP
jgi:hypothetical protein